MSRLHSFYCLLFLFCTTAIAAQKKYLMHWTIAAELPAINNQSTSLGFAGPVVGVQHGVLIVAGGANFPDAMPWLGGKKKYYSDAYALKQNSNGCLEVFNIFQLPGAIAYAACSSTPQGIVCAGGENNNGISNNVWLLQ